jgi:anti-sigma factor RsiW
MARQNDHTRAEELISAYLDKQLSAEEKDFFERHIASCADCRAQLEATRSMIAALRAMPAVKAPRSFVLPREMGKQPWRSFLSLYPALRLATVVAALAFVVLFAGDLLLNQMGGSSAPQRVPAAVPAVMQAPVAARQIAPTAEAAAAESFNLTATLPSEQPAPAAGAAKLSETPVVSEAVELSMVTAAPDATLSADSSSMAAPMAAEATPESTETMLDQQAEVAAEQSAAASAVEAAPAPTVDPLRVIEIALLALVIVLATATFVVRRRQA